MSTLLLLLAPLAPVQGEWTTLPLPAVCEERADSVSFPPLLDGRHLRLDEEFAERIGGARSALQPSDVGGLLQTAAAGGDATIEVFPFSPPLLVRGTPENLEWARAQVGGLDAAGRRSRLVVTALLQPSARAAADGVASSGPRRWSGTVTSGDEIAFGPRDRIRFLGSYDIEVATDSGVAAPIVGSAFTGKTLHLTPSRIDGGRRVHVRGLLDLSELQRIEVFESGTPDLGDFQQPVINAVSVAFSGVVELGGSLTVELEGTPLEQPDWTLQVSVTGEAEPAQLAEGDWRALDVALLSGRGRILPAFDPGAALDDQLGLKALGPLAQSLSASGIVSAVESRPRGGSRSSAGNQRAPQHVGETLILISAARENGGDQARLPELVRTLEAPRRETARVEITRGDFRASFPVAGGEAARLLVGVERTLLTGYQVEIAPNTWMPSPIVEHAFDGLAWQGRLADGEVAATAWVARTHEIEHRRRDQTSLAAIQLPHRAADGASWSEKVGADAAGSPAAEASLGLRMSLSRP